MKKILFLAMAAAAMVSCSQNEEFENAGKQAEIKFQSLVKAGTKATVITTGTLDKFTVNAYKTTEAMGSTVTLTSKNALKEGLLVKKTGNAFGYDGDPIYWPATGKVQFFATSPVKDPVMSLTLPAQGYPTFDYTVGLIDAQEDLIAANEIDKTKADGTVKFAFRHLLTQVNFSIKGDLKDCTYKVTKLELVGVKNKATFAFDGTANVGTWGNLGADDGTYVWEDATGVTLTPADITSGIARIGSVDANTALFMLIPQDFTTNNASLKITYSATPKGASEATFDGEKTVKLTEKWEMSHNFHYILKLTSDATQLTFDTPEIGDWTEESPQPEKSAGN